MHVCQIIYISVDVTLGRKCVYFSVKFEIAQIKEFKFLIFSLQCTAGIVKFVTNISPI